MITIQSDAVTTELIKFLEETVYVKRNYTVEYTETVEANGCCEIYRIYTKIVNTPLRNFFKAFLKQAAAHLTLSIYNFSYYDGSSQHMYAAFHDKDCCVSINQDAHAQILKVLAKKSSKIDNGLAFDLIDYLNSLKNN
jgi:hypothetical protein